MTKNQYDEIMTNLNDKIVSEAVSSSKSNDKLLAYLGVENIVEEHYQEFFNKEVSKTERNIIMKSLYNLNEGQSNDYYKGLNEAIRIVKNAIDGGREDNEKIRDLKTEYYNGDVDEKEKILQREIARRNLEADDLLFSKYFNEYEEEYNEKDRKSINKKSKFLDIER